ncbi:MAG TPA: (d)CMP kinase [Roseiarcus sp.]|nr:(d)CMP kinase [Roseiarcus sp.]
MRRDARDSNRSVAPLRRADDAMTLDTTHLGIEAASAEALRIIETARTRV